jgi:hypothetical protein
MSKRNGKRRNRKPTPYRNGRNSMPIDSDERIGLWPPSRLLAMDRRFVEQVERAFKNGDESREAASAGSTRLR